MSELPVSWVEVKIGQISDVISGGTPNANDPKNFAMPGEGIAWLTPADLSGYNAKEISHGARDLSQQGYQSCSAKLMPRGSLLFSSRAPIGYVALAANEVSTNQGFKSFVFPKEIDPSYAYYYLKSIRQLADSLGTGTTFKELSGTTAKTLPFRMAPTNEQARIAQKLDGLLAQVDTLKARIDAIPALLKRFRQSVLAAAVSGRLTEEWRDNDSYKGQVNVNIHKGNKPGNVEPKEMYCDSPSTWQWERLGAAVKLINGDRGKNYPNKSEYVEDGIPFINTGHIDPSGTLSAERMNFITKEKFDSLGGGKIRSGDLVYCLRGATMGKTALVDPLTEGAIASSLVIIRVNHLLLSKFAYLYLTSPQGKDLISRFDNGSAQPNLSAGSLSSYPIAIPHITEQTEIVRRVEQLFAFADQLEAKVASAKSRIDHLTQSILAKAFRGELVPQDPNDEPASVLLERIRAQRAAAPKTKHARKNA